MSNYHFLPHVRRGVGKLIQARPAPQLGRNDAPAGLSGRLSLPLTVKLNAAQVSLKDQGVVSLYGPGDVIGIDSREIIRTAPLDLTPDFPPERFAFIEFDHPEFPWLFTPGVPDESNCLRPWLILVVIEKSKATITPPAGNALPVLSCPVAELPNMKTSGQEETDLSESWAWAHAVYAGDIGNSTLVEAMLNKDPPVRNLSRLLCTRRLEPLKTYEACLVPAFEAGRKAGLGLNFDPATEALAHWRFEKDDEVKLPVYHHWSFSTGNENQFIKLAEQLQALSQEEEEAARSGIAGEMDLSDLVKEQKLPIPSALRITPRPAETPGPIKDKLQERLTQPPGTAIPLPAYGSWHAPAADLATQLNSHPWLKTLNLDPRYRVAAALGTSVIQKEQDLLVAAAWEQVGELQAVNEFLNRKEFARYVTGSIHTKRLQNLSAFALRQIMEPVSLEEPSSESGFRQPDRLRVNGLNAKPQSAVKGEALPALSAQQMETVRTDYPALVLADRPLAYYRLNEASGSKTVSDASGQSRQSYVEAGVRFGVPGLVVDDTAVQFDGETGRIIVENSDSLNPPTITMEAIIQWQGPHAAQPDINQRILEKSSFQSVAQYNLCVAPDGSIIVELRMLGTTTNVSAKSRDTITANHVVHIVATFDGSMIRIYLNGQLSSETPSPGRINPQLPTDENLIESGLGIGNETQRTRPFHGIIDEIALYDHALSSDQIRLHVASLSPEQTPLEHIATLPQFRRISRGAWRTPADVSQYPLEQIAPAPGTTAGASEISGGESPESSGEAANVVLRDVADLQKQVRLLRTEPQLTFESEVNDRVKISGTDQLTRDARPKGGFQQQRALGSFVYEPSFSQPMYVPLRDQFPHMLLPGLDKIPNDRVALLEVDPQFIEAYLVGLNHELSREFLWREFPTRLNVTYFQQFWDAQSAENSKTPDLLKPIDQWANNELGENLAPNRGGALKFLLIRGELMVRYPNVMIYARKNGSDENAAPLFPVLRFSPIAGVALVGFFLGAGDPPEVLKNWRFFVEEHFTEPYLGPDPATNLPEGSPYVSFAQAPNGSPLYPNSAFVAKACLRSRYYRELQVLRDATNG